MAMKDRRQSRDGTKVIWLALHTSEGNDTLRVDDAISLIRADWWEGSSHAVCDDVALYMGEADGCVDPAWAAWTLRNGNNRSENIEQIGRAAWSRDEWLTNRMGTLRNTAQWLAARSKARGIPLTYVGTQGVRDRRMGVIQHNDYSVGTGDGTHWDCGPGYPTDVVIDLAREYQHPTAEPTPAPKPRRAATMFLYAVQSDADPEKDSAVRIFSGRTDYGITDADAREIGKALADPAYVALVGRGTADALVAGSK